MDNRPDGVVPATPEVATVLAGRIAPEHSREVREISGMEPGEALRLSLSGSLEAYAVFSPAGVLLFMMGVEPASPLTGGAMLWMLGGRKLRNHPAATLRAARWGVDRAFRITGAQYLEQYIPDWYETGLRFAVRLGFDILPIRPPRPNGSALAHVILRRR